MTRHAKHKPSKVSGNNGGPLGSLSPEAVAFAHTENDQQSQLHDAPLLVLHVIRILALYLSVLLTQLRDDALPLHEIFFPDPTLVASTASQIEQHVHAALLACVKGEIASNQFDGLIHEKTVFAALRRAFRQQNVHATAQCQLLARLLDRYLAQLQHAPIVHCESMGMLASTLEYLAQGATRDDPRNETVALSLLYPLVNAIDSLSIEQRECLDALTTLWRWLGARDPSEKLLDRIIGLQHTVIFVLEPTKDAGKTPFANSSVVATELGACFVRTLVRHADHIFRHDLDFTDSHDLFSSGSDTEELDDFNSTAPLFSLPEAPSTPPSTKRSKAPSISPAKTKKQQQQQKKLKATSGANSCKTVAAAAVANQQHDDTAMAAIDVIDANEPMPASMMRVGIAAAAGTLAAALCVIFT